MGGGTAERRRDGRRGAGEHVLVFERARLDDLGWFTGLQSDWQPYVERLFTPGVCAFRDRLEVEEDERFKQLIAYVLMEHEGRFLFYLRGNSAGEQRLADRGSMGVGGHVGTEDDSLFGHEDLHALYQRAVDREVREEVHVDAGHTSSVLGVINDDRDPVGRVHFGIVHLWRLTEPLVRRREAVLRQLRFAAPPDIRASGAHLESWSELCLEHLEATA
jgi:predicted NUDIX family phosphoesterase